MIKHRRTKPPRRGPRIDKPPNWRKSVRGICRDLVAQHSTDISAKLRDGLSSQNPKLALKFIAFVASYESGKPVETHRMASLTDGPEGIYDLTRLTHAEQSLLLRLLKKSRDDATSQLPPPTLPASNEDPDANDH